ncbi:MAG: SDR family NAD(P)-dependent oxidoreductase [Alphaproteobacteria bacterium]|nr:MAG: SDR family NAD(P)-dependent oxidoreductase [Alphaproteobacteria bacterium]
MSVSSQPASIFITGASSGIGAALARRYAGPGVHLFLHGRDEARLRSCAKAARAAGAQVTTFIGDVTDRKGMLRTIEAADNERPLDLLIANAGVSMEDRRDIPEEDAAERIFAVNVAGVFHTAMPALARMRERGRGRIAIVSSLAAYHGLPVGPLYSASKAAIKAWGEGLRVAHASKGVRISIICPGFIRTPMTARNRFPMPFLMTAEEAAERIARRLARGDPLIAFPRSLAAALRIIDMLPARLGDRLLGALVKA